MEDDDEFGDLYTDVLRPFASPSSSASHPHQSSPAPAPPSIDLNLNLNASQIPSDASLAVSPAPHQLPPPDLQAPPPSAAEEPRKIPDGEPQPNANLAAADAGIDPIEREVKFDIEEEDEGGGGGGSPVIPGLAGEAPAEEGGEGDDWDTDSEDDLKIVLNENNHMAMERGGMVEGDEEEEDGDEELVIVAGGDPNQGMEEQEWGENAALGAGEGERKDGAGELAKAGVAVAPKIGYSNHGYHPFHSQFKVSVD